MLQPQASKEYGLKAHGKGEVQTGGHSSKKWSMWHKGHQGGVGGVSGTVQGKGVGQEDCGGWVLSQSKQYLATLVGA
jgi:hypothetical protein